MDITNGRVGSGLAVTPRAAGVVNIVRILFRHEGWEYMFIYVSGRERRLAPGLRVLVCKVIVELVPLLYLVVLVISCPDNNSRSPAHSLNLLSCLELKVLDIGIIGGVASACKLKIVPHENAKLIAGIKKSIILIDATTPDADHDLVAVCHELDPVIVALGRNPREVAISGDPAGAATKYIHVIYTEVKGFTMDVRFLNESGSAEPGESRQ